MIRVQLVVVLIISAIVTLQLSSTPVHSQGLSFSYYPPTEDFSDDEFRMDLHKDVSEARTVRIRGNELVFGDGSNMISGAYQWAFSENRAYIGALYVQGNHVSVEIYRTDGTLVNRIHPVADYDPDDPSIRLFMRNDGSFIYQDNIAGFSFFDKREGQLYRASNSSGSPDGETISELFAPAAARSVFLVNPEIYHGERVQSRVQSVDYVGSPIQVALFEGMRIIDIQVHSTGRLLLVHAEEQASGHHFGFVLSYRGHNIAEIDYEDELMEELVLSSCGGYVTGRASGRVMVHETISGERMGSASFRETVLIAQYMPDQVLAVITGRKSTERNLNDLRGHMIDLQQRDVIRERTELNTIASEYFPLKLEYINSGSYLIRGTSRYIQMRHEL